MSSTVAILVTDAQKTAIVAAVNALTPEYTIGFSRGIVPISPVPTWQTVPTHWYTNASSVPEDVLAEWQGAAPSMEGMILFIAVNAENPLEWAYSNLASQGLRFVPDSEE